MSFKTLVVNPSTGVELSYIDSGPPEQKEYTTIFAIHGLSFTNGIFQKVIDLAPSKGIRFVALNRRAFPGSTPFTPEERNVIFTGGSGDAERDAHIEARGHEIAAFVVEFIRKYDLPPPTRSGGNDDLPSGGNDDLPGGGNGGVAILGWSQGVIHAFAAVATAETLEKDVKDVLRANLRSLIVYEPPTIVLGLGVNPRDWTPLSDTSMPETMRLAAFSQWVTAYFDHGDLSTRDPDQLACIVPSQTHVPTVYNIPPEQWNSIVRQGEDTATDLAMLGTFQGQLLRTYRKAFFDSDGGIFPGVRRSVVVGDRSGAFAFFGLWALLDDVEKLGGDGGVEFRMVEGINHFGHWDYPERVLEALVELF